MKQLQKEETNQAGMGMSDQVLVHFANKSMHQ